MERFPLPLGAWDGLRYFIVALPEPYIQLFYSDWSCSLFGLIVSAEKKQLSMKQIESVKLKESVKKVKPEQRDRHQSIYIRVDLQNLQQTVKS